MRHLKPFEDFIREGVVKKVSVKGFSEKDIQFADQLRYFRNGILYYGTSLDKEYADKVLEFTKKTHSKLKELLRGEQ